MAATNASKYAQLQQRQQEALGSTLTTVRHCQKLSQESVYMGVSTLAELDAQGQQLTRVEEGLTKVDEQTTKAGRIIEEMQAHKCCCGCCMCCWPCWPFCPRRLIKKRPALSSSQTKKPPPNSVTEALLPKGLPLPKGGWPNLVLNDAQEAEIHQGLDVVSENIATLRQQAVTMGDTLTTQNTQLERLQPATQYTTQHITAQTGRIRSLLH
jgi:hypothetical protein